MTDEIADALTDDADDEVTLYLEKLAEALQRLGMIEMEGVVLDGSDVAQAIMAIDAQLTAGWQLAEAVRWSKEMSLQFERIDALADRDEWQTASQNSRYADEAVTVALAGWDEAAGLDGDEAGLPASAS
jgi:hypothetical protein